MRNDDYMRLLIDEIDGEVSLCALRDAVKEKRISILDDIPVDSLSLRKAFVH